MCFDNDDQWDCDTVKTSKARKRHQCCDCFAPIEVGSLYVQTTGLFDGSWSKHKACGQCELARWLIHVKELVDGCSWGDSRCMGEVREAAREYEIDWPTADEGQRFLAWREKQQQLLQERSQ